MIEPITASFRWTKDEFLRAQRLAMRHAPKSRLILRVTTLIGALILLSGIVGVHNRTLGWAGFAFTVFYSGIFFSVPLFARRAARKMYAQKPDRDMQVTWEISDDIVRTKTELASSENAWAFFQKVRRLREGFLIYPSGNIFHWLPLHAFRDPADAERFAELAKSKVRDYADLEPVTK